jgi:hypothetical protein
VHRLTRHLRGLLVALAALVLTTGAVLAARPASVEAPPAAAGDGLTRASEAARKTVPVRPETPAAPEGDEDEDVDENVPEADEEEGAAEDAAGERPQNHGWFVSEAAKAETPDGFDNHGAAVSEVARGDEGKPEAATAAREAGSAKAEAAKARKAERSQRREGSNK